MANLLTITCILVTYATVMVTCVAQMAPSEAPAEGPGTGSGAVADCSTLIYTMMDCMTFVTSDVEAKPDAACCTGLQTVINTDASCVCDAMSTAASLGMGINMTRAATMPSLCGTTGNIPSMSSCSGSASPGSSPGANIPPPMSPTLPPSTIEPPSSGASPTIQPPPAATSPGGAPPEAALSPPAPPTPPPKHKKSGAYTISTTFNFQPVLLFFFLSH